MKFLYRWFHKDPESRENIISMTSGLGIAVNLLIASVKVVVGFLASSIAIVSEGVNNASDALTSVLTLVGSKLAGRHPNEKHPFGYGRVEYLTSMVIAVLILITGGELVINSIKRIFSPEALSVSYLSLIIIAVSAVMKFFLGLYTMKMGKKAKSGALEAVGVDCRNDAFISVITIFTALIFLIFQWNIDAYAGVITSLVIIKAGVDILIDTISDLIGRSGEKELANRLYRRILNTEGVIGAADMILHNYGPDAYHGSVNVEIDHAKSVGEVYQVIHKLQLDIMHEEHVTMVFGIYAVANDHEYMRELRGAIARFVKSKEHIESFHAVYIDSETNVLYCDFIVDYQLSDWEGLRKEFLEYMKPLYPDKTVELTVETAFV